MLRMTPSTVFCVPFSLILIACSHRPTPITVAETYDYDRGDDPFALTFEQSAKIFSQMEREAFPKNHSNVTYDIGGYISCNESPLKGTQVRLRMCYISKRKPYFMRADQCSREI